jgi:AAA domain
MNWDETSFEEACRKADAVRGNGKANIEPRFKLQAFRSLMLGTSAVYLVKGIIPRHGLTVVWGPPKCGKSFWVFDVMMHIALGWPYRGRRIQQGPVVYCAFEGAEGFKARAEAFRQRHLAEDHGEIDFHLIGVRANLVKDHAELIGAIRTQLRGKPASVTLDTLNRSIQGSESDDKDMTAYIAAADAIREAFGCAVIIVHHCGVEGTRPRGHTSLTGAVDAQLSVKRDTAGNVLVTVEWMKDGPEGDTIASRIESLDVGMDDEGEMITSCVVVPAEYDPARAANVSRKLSDRQRLALDALSEATASSGKSPPPAWQLPAGIQVVATDTWREVLMSKSVIDRDATNPRQDFKRLRQALAARKLIGDKDEHVWRV